MSPVPSDPFNFVNGTTADGDQVDARFLPLYTALSAALDETNLAAALKDVLGVSDAGVKRRGKSIVATAESRTNTAFGVLTTPDRISSLVLPTDGLLIAAFDARWQESVAGAGRAALFLGANQIDVAYGNTPGGHGVEAARTGSSSAAIYRPLASCPIGLIGLDNQSVAAPSPLTTGQVMGFAPSTSTPQKAAFEVAGNVPDTLLTGGGLCLIFAAAGTYDLSVQYKSSSGSVTVKDRKLWALALGF